MNDWHLYNVHCIHRRNDWDATFEFKAPDAKTARKWALNKLAEADMWIVVRAKRVKALQ